MNELNLDRLNKVADILISNEKEYPLELDLLLNMFRKMAKEPDIKQPKAGVNILLNREETLKNDSIDGIFNTVQIPQNEIGVEKLFENMKKQIEPYRVLTEKRTNDFER